MEQPFDSYLGLEIAFIVDGKHQRIPKPSTKELRLRYWSGKAQDYTLLSLVFISPSGLILLVVGSYPGKWSIPEVEGRFLISHSQGVVWIRQSGTFPRCNIG